MKRTPRPSSSLLIAEIRAWLSAVSNHHTETVPFVGRMKITKKLSDGSRVTFTYAEPRARK